MTNGEKIETILNVDRDCTEVHGENGTMTFTVTQDWWNAEYKEPTTKDCLAVEQIVDEVIKKVMPIKPKGHWILTDVEGDRIWHCKCSECGKDPQDYIGGSEDWWLIKNKLPKFCPSCRSDNGQE